MFRLRPKPGSNASLICNAIAGCSLGVAALTWEDKRRQIAFLQRVIDNTRFLQQYNAHPLVARLETVATADDGNSFPLKVRRLQDGRPLPPFNEMTTTMTKKWMIRKRVRRRRSNNANIQTPINTLASPSSLEDTKLFIQQCERTSKGRSSSDGTTYGTDYAQRIPSHRSVLVGGKCRPQSLKVIPRRLPNARSRSIHTSRQTRLQTGQIIYTEGPLLTEIETKYARHLEGVLANRLKDCLASHDTKMHKSGLEELFVYLKSHRGRVTPQLYDAMRMSYRKITEPESPLFEWKSLAESTYFQNALVDGPTQSETLAPNRYGPVFEVHGVGGPACERGMAARVLKYLRNEWLYTAAFEVWDALETLSGPISLELGRAICALISALKDLGAFSIVKDIHIKLLELDNFQLDLDQLSWLVSHEIPENTAQLCLSLAKRLYPESNSNNVRAKGPGAKASLNQMIRLCYRKKLYHGILDLVRWVGLETACGCGRPDTIYCVVQKAGPIATAKDVINYLPDWTTTHKYYTSVTQEQPGMLRERVIDTHRRLLRRCWWDTGNMALTEEIFEAISLKLQKPTMLRWIYPIMIRAYVEAGRVAEAKFYVDKVSDAFPNEFRIDLTAELMLAQAAQRRWNEVERIWETIEKNPDALIQCRKFPRVFHKLFQQYCNQHTAMEALSYILGVSRRLGFFLPRPVLRYLMNKIIYEQDEEGLRQLLTYLQSQGQKPVVSKQSLQRLVAVSGSNLVFDAPRSSAKGLALVPWNSDGPNRSFEHLSSIFSTKQAPINPAVSASSGVDKLVESPETFGPSEGLESHAETVLMGPPAPRSGKESRTDHLNAVMRAMLERMRAKKPIEALQIYHSSLVHGLPRHDVDLCLAVQATLAIDPHSADAAEALIDSAKANGMNVFRAYQPLLLHSINTHPSTLPIYQARQIIENFYRAAGAAPLLIPLDHHVTVAIVRHLLYSKKDYAAMDIMERVAASEWAVRRPLDIVPMTLMLQICTKRGLHLRMERVLEDVLDRNLRIDRHFLLALRAGRNRYRRILQGCSPDSRLGSKAPEMTRMLEHYLELFKQRKIYQQRKAQEFQSTLVDAVRGFYEGENGSLKATDDTHPQLAQCEQSVQQMPGRRMEAKIGYELLAEQQQQPMQAYA